MIYFKDLINDVRYFIDINVGKVVMSMLALERQHSISINLVPETLS